MNRIKKIMGLFLLLVATSLVIYILADLAGNFKTQRSITLEQLWTEDLEKLQLANQLPEAWKQIRYVEKIAANGDPTADLWLKNLAFPIEIAPEGNYKLEVLLISQESESGKEQAVIQHNLVELGTGNTIWELARTYDLTP